ncbi:hypothetical protein SBRCBS47491_004139 [Sporothrix bragantina]|uniref:Red-like protein n=1 Tax=Sporothrix bragantina TaxID=671064 RepID=A0ABP0BMH9_9PEZI
MNNDQFRKLAFGSGASSSASSGSASAPGNASASSNAPKALGSRQKASIPMTRRHGDVGRVAFARQMAERYNNANNDSANDKKQKVRTSRPKGTQFAAGYVDRAKLRAEAENDNGEGGTMSTHPKGLDFQLLERARRGDVEGDGEAKGEEDNTEETREGGPDVDDEFEKIESADVQAVEREKTKKKGQYSTAAPPGAAAAGQKRSRDQILAEMKAAREAAKQAQAAKAEAEPALGSRFKKIGPSQQQQKAGSRIEIDSRGREVLILVDEDGHEKRKVRKVKAPAAEEKPEGNGTVLGMEVPEFYRKKLEAEAAAAAAKEVDIFDDVGSDYDPLAGMDSASSEEDDDNDNDDDDKQTKESDAKRRRRSSSASSRSDGEVSDTSRGSRGRRRRAPSEERRRSTKDERTRDKAPAAAAPPRKNYFGNSTLLSESTSRGGPSMQDPSVLAALRKAKQLREASEADAQNQALSEEAAREARLKKLLQSSERDAEDLDMGFGSSRLEDTEDLDDAGGGKKVRLSTWKGGEKEGDYDDDDGAGGGSRGDKGKRKRSGKKRKGDGNNAEDVMRVLERRREEGK